MYSALEYYLRGMGSYTNYVPNFLEIFDPPSPLYTKLVNECRHFVNPLYAMSPNYECSGFLFDIEIYEII